MKFKHAFNVFIDNFSVTYKQLLYRLIILAVSLAVCFAGVYPFIKEFLNSDSFNSIISDTREFINNLLGGNVEALKGISEKIAGAYSDFINLLYEKTGRLVLCGFILLVIILVARWFTGLGNYAAAAVINDKMAMRTSSPFLGSMIRNLKQASLYSLIYVPLTCIYDLGTAVLAFFLVYLLVYGFLPLILGIFLFVLLIILAISIKMTFVNDWMPALIRGKAKQGEAIKYTFSRKNKRTFNVMSNYVVLTLLSFAVNAAALFLTFGVGMLITVPASYLVVCSFQLVSYYEREQIRYSIDDNTIIKPKQNHTLTREEFFRGEDD